jgi:Aminotransferase class-V
MKDIYLDHNATTPVLPGVLAAMLPFFEESPGNPSSEHTAGGKARTAIERARDCSSIPKPPDCLLSQHLRLGFMDMMGIIEHP